MYLLVLLALASQLYFIAKSFLLGFVVGLGIDEAISTERKIAIYLLK